MSKKVTPNLKVQCTAIVLLVCRRSYSLVISTLGLKMNGHRNRNPNLPKQFRDLNLSCFIRLSVLLGLCGYTSFIVYRGPFSMLIRNTTVIRENEINSNDEGM